MLCAVEDSHVGIPGSVPSPSPTASVPPSGTPIGVSGNDERASKWNSQTFSGIREFLFIIFVNAMFTTFVEPRFTKAFE
ncbi:hypothetical protein SAMN05216374_1084 [Tardiphaga sp. OK246]|nr:hypothetical protein SAMN05216374_1084 [Tardiphaga sp. OK246]